MGPVSIPKYELPDNFQIGKNPHRRLFGRVSLLWEKIKHRFSLLSSTLQMIYIFNIFFGGQKNDPL